MGQNSPAESEPLCSQIRMKAPFQPVASWIPLTVLLFISGFLPAKSAYQKSSDKALKRQERERR